MVGANVLMTSTLPTIIGMGVVSRSTEVMFSRGGKVKSAKAPGKRINGKVYNKSAKSWSRKSEALRVAKRMRALGYKARVEPVGNRYWVYWRA